MLRRLMALLVALVMLVAPVAGEVCVAACGQQQADAVSSHEHQHSCAPQSSASGAAVTASQHACGEMDSVPAGPDGIRQTLTPPAIVAALLPAVPPSAGRQPIDHGLPDKPPFLIAIASQLRI